MKMLHQFHRMFGNTIPTKHPKQTSFKTNDRYFLEKDELQVYHKLKKRLLSFMDHLSIDIGIVTGRTSFLHKKGRTGTIGGRSRQKLTGLSVLRMMGRSRS